MKPAIRNYSRGPTRSFTFTHLPAISLPCGFTPAGLPVGVQLVEQFVSDERFRNDTDRCKSAKLAADTAISTSASPGPWRALATRYCQTSQETD